MSDEMLFDLGLDYEDDENKVNPWLVGIRVNGKEYRVSRSRSAVIDRDLVDWSLDNWDFKVREDDRLNYLGCVMKRRYRHGL